MVDQGTAGFLRGAIKHLGFCVDDYSTLSDDTKNELKEIMERLHRIEKTGSSKEKNRLN